MIESHEELKKLREEFRNRVENVTDKANLKLQSYLTYAYLWTESRKDFMYFFINYSRQLTEEEIVALEDDDKCIKRAISEANKEKEAKRKERDNREKRSSYWSM